MLILRARSSPYAKRWWNRELTELKTKQSQLRNWVRRLHRDGVNDLVLEEAAKAATKRYYNVIYYQKKSHWEKFIAERDNIWKVVKLMEPKKLLAFAKVPPLIRANNSVIENEIQKARELFNAFYPHLPTMIDEEPQTDRVTPIKDPKITKEEVKSKVFSANPWKAPGRDRLLTAVWQQIWPAVEEEVVNLFRASFNEGYFPHQ